MSAAPMGQGTAGADYFERLGSTIWDPTQYGVKCRLDVLGRTPPRTPRRRGSEGRHRVGGCRGGTAPHASAPPPLASMRRRYVASSKGTSRV